VSAPLPGSAIPRREMITLRRYVRSGSYKAAAWELGISESTARQRVSSLIRRLGVRNVTQAVWMLHIELEREPVMAERQREP
jgi:DNA-binding NarL/FixJ family response regulator